MQLMEMAGLSVASALHLEYDASSYKRVLILVGPGNNGGGEQADVYSMKHCNDPCAL